MRKIIRGDAPPCLVAGCKAWTDRYLTARTANPAEKFSWYSKACYDSTRSALLTMTQDHCAFCDGFVGNEGRETVEHFRPKSQFPQEAFLWTNLLPCCDVCQSAKLEKYDDLLLKPDDGGYAFERYFICNYAEGELQPAPGIKSLERVRAEKTIALYALNAPKRKIARVRELKKYHLAAQEMTLDEFPYRWFLAG